MHAHTQIHMCTHTHTYHTHTHKHTCSYTRGVFLGRGRWGGVREQASKMVTYEAVTTHSRAYPLKWKQLQHIECTNDKLHAYSHARTHR